MPVRGENLHIFEVRPRAGQFQTTSSSDWRQILRNLREQNGNNIDLNPVTSVQAEIANAQIEVQEVLQATQTNILNAQNDIQQVAINSAGLQQNVNILSLLYNWFTEMGYNILLWSSRILNCETQFMAVTRAIEPVVGAFKITGAITTFIIFGGLFLITVIYTWRGGKWVVNTIVMPAGGFIRTGLTEINTDIRNVRDSITGNSENTSRNNTPIDSSPVRVSRFPRLTVLRDIISQIINGRSSYSPTTSGILSTTVYVATTDTCQGNSKFKSNSSLSKQTEITKIFKRKITSGINKNNENLVEKTDIINLKETIVKKMLLKSQIVVFLGALQLIALYYIYFYFNKAFTYKQIEPFSFFGYTYFWSFEELMLWHTFVCIITMLIPFFCHWTRFPILSVMLGQVIGILIQVKTTWLFIISITTILFKHAQSLIKSPGLFFKDYITNNGGIEIIETIYKTNAFIIKIFSSTEDKYEIIRTIANNHLKKIMELNPKIDFNIVEFKDFIEKNIENIKTTPELLDLYFNSKNQVGQIIYEKLVSNYIILKLFEMQNSNINKMTNSVIGPTGSITSQGSVLKSSGINTTPITTNLDGNYSFFGFLNKCVMQIGDFIWHNPIISGVIGFVIIGYIGGTQLNIFNILQKTSSSAEILATSTNIVTRNLISGQAALHAAFIKTGQIIGQESVKIQILGTTMITEISRNIALEQKLLVLMGLVNSNILPRVNASNKFLNLLHFFVSDTSSIHYTPWNPNFSNAEQTAFMLEVTKFKKNFSQQYPIIWSVLSNFLSTAWS